MIYNEKALGRLLRDIGMEIPFGYLIKGKGAEKIYGPLHNRSKGYEAVAEAISAVLHSEEFKKDAKSRLLLTRSERTRDELLQRDFTEEEIGSFERLYGIGYEKKSYEAVSHETGMTTNEIIRIEKRVKKIMKEGKDKKRPAEYRSEIWKHVYGKMKS